MKLISCVSWRPDRPDLEMRSVDDVTNGRDEETAFFVFSPDTFEVSGGEFDCELNASVA